MKINKNQLFNSYLDKSFYRYLLTYNMQISKTYKSRIDNWLIAIIAIPFLIVMILPMLESTWVGVLIVLPVSAFVTHMFATTDYTVNGTTLKVRSGFFVNISVDIASIKSISETNTILGAPAASLDRLEITYNKYDSVVISPKNKAEFISDILAINSQITVTYKK